MLHYNTVSYNMKRQTLKLIILLAVSVVYFLIIFFYLHTLAECVYKLYIITKT